MVNLNPKQGDFINQLKREAKNLLENLSLGSISPSAYDIAWIARIPQKDKSKPKYLKCLEWIQDNQLKDGSWGEKIIEYYHDRIISTLSCIIALKIWGVSDDLIKKGEDYININLKNLIKDSHDNIGFELIFISMLDKAKSLKLNLKYDSLVITKYYQLRDLKLKKISIESLYSIRSTLAHSIEFIENLENIDFKRLLIQQYSNGSFGNSPSATSFILINFYNKDAELYLDGIIKVFLSNIPSIYPFEIFEKSWILENFNLSKMNIDKLKLKHLNYLFKNWDPIKGISISNSFPISDLDDSSVVFSILKSNKYNLNIDFINFFKREKHFICYPFERNPSVSTYVHLLEALNKSKRTLKINNIINETISFIVLNRDKLGYLNDKWQISPYYTTCHFIIELIKIGDILNFEISLKWLLENQFKNGSWGFFNKGTVEETSYVLQSLMFYKQKYKSNRFDNNIINGIKFLKNSLNKNYYVSLWVDKVLYTPYALVDSLLINVLYTYELSI